MSAEQIQDAEVVSEDEAARDVGHELERVDTQVGKIIVAERPEEILTKATDIANVLAQLVAAQDLARDVGGRKKHVEVGAWQALGALLGAFGGQPLHAETVWSRRVADADGRPEVKTYHAKETRKKWGKVDGRRQIVEETDSEYDVEGCDWEARVEIRTASGVVVGVAEAMCSRAELGWMSKPDPAVKSMAETRAESRAYRRAVGWLMVIAGYNPTPAEEMPPQAEPESASDPGPRYGPAVAEQQLANTRAALGYLLGCDPMDNPVGLLLNEIQTRAGGYLPHFALSMIALSAQAAKDRREQQQAAKGEVLDEDPADRHERELGDGLATDQPSDPAIEAAAEEFSKPTEEVDRAERLAAEHRGAI